MQLLYQVYVYRVRFRFYQVAKEYLLAVPKKSNKSSVLKLR